jgi:hypothetical protein
MIKAGIKKNQFPSLPPKKTHFISVANCRSQITLEHKNSRQFQAPEDEERKHILYIGRMSSTGVFPFSPAPSSCTNNIRSRPSYLKPLFLRWNSEETMASFIPWFNRRTKSYRE